MLSPPGTALLRQTRIVSITAVNLPLLTTIINPFGKFRYLHQIMGTSLTPRIDQISKNSIMQLHMAFKVLCRRGKTIIFMGLSIDKVWEGIWMTVHWIRGILAHKVYLPCLSQLFTFHISKAIKDKIILSCRCFILHIHSHLLLHLFQFNLLNISLNKSLNKSLNRSLIYQLTRLLWIKSNKTHNLLLKIFLSL